ncbi:MAG: hypothetical protein AAF621_03040 [Pseudomonadota bacterium]
MESFEAAREKMIKSQLVAVGVRNASVLEAIRKTPREHFVPKEFRVISYSGKEIPVSKNGRYMLEPMVTGKFFQSAELDGKQNILIIGDSTGYFGALVSGLAQSVTLLETEEFVETLRENMSSFEPEEDVSIEVVSGDLTKGYAAKAPYDIIFINGSVKQIPDELFKQISAEGYILTAFRRGYICDAVKYFLDGAGNVQHEKLFECSIGFLPEFNKKPSFML